MVIALRLNILKSRNHANDCSEQVDYDVNKGKYLNLQVKLCGKPIRLNGRSRVNDLENILDTCFIICTNVSALLYGYRPLLNLFFFQILAYNGLTTKNRQSVTSDEQQATFHPERAATVPAAADHFSAFVDEAFQLMLARSQDIGLKAVQFKLSMKSSPGDAEHLGT